MLATTVRNLPKWYIYRLDDDYDDNDDDDVDDDEGK